MMKRIARIAFALALFAAPTQAQPVWPGALGGGSGGTVSGVTPSNTSGPLATGDCVLIFRADNSVACATYTLFTVPAITATGATIAGAPSTGNSGSAIAGLTDTLTPSGATGYASITVGGTEQTPRVAFTGTSVPSLTPNSTGTATIAIYAAATGGTALATSGSITVGGVAATAATFSSVPTTGTSGTALASGGTVTFTPSGSAGYVVLHNGTAEQGSRVSASTGALPSLTPSAAGTFTVKAFAALTGGTALATSPSITVAAGGNVTPYILSLTDTLSPPGALGTGQSPSALPQTFGGGNLLVLNGGDYKIYFQNATTGATCPAMRVVLTRSSTVVPSADASNGTGWTTTGSNGAEIRAQGYYSNNPSLKTLQIASQFVYRKTAPGDTTAGVGNYYLFVECTDSGPTVTWTSFGTPFAVSN